MIGRSTEVPGVAWVRADEEGGAYLATRHLIELGHTAIGLVSVRAEDNPVVREREAGMRRALAWLRVADAAPSGGSATGPSSPGMPSVSRS